jgi:hypothetical protein
MVCENGYALSSGECKKCSDEGRATTTTALVLSILAACTLMGVALCRLRQRPAAPLEDHKEDSGPLSSSEAAAAGRLGVQGSMKKLVSTAGSIRGLVSDHLPSVSKSASFIKGKVDAGAWGKQGAKGKIMLSFAQITNQIQFVYDIPFPVNFSKLISSMGFVNLDILTMIGVGCVAPFSFYDRLFALTLIPIGLAAALGTIYKHSSSSVPVKNKCVAWFLKLSYLVFPGVSTVVLQTFPCITFDTGDSFLKADLSIDCNAPERPAMLLYAVLMMIVYPIGITARYAVLLWKQRKAICPIEGQWRSCLGIKDVFPPRLDSTKEEDAVTETRKEAIQTNPDLSSIQFLFKDYEPYYWWYEIFECVRRLMLTGGSVMFMEGSATQVVCGMLIALMSVHVFSMCQPFIDDNNDKLALGSQWVIFFTLFGGLLLKLNLNYADGYDKDGSGVGVFLMTVNILVVVIGAGTCLFGIYTTQITSSASTFMGCIMKLIPTFRGKTTGRAGFVVGKSGTGASVETDSQPALTTNPAFESSTPSSRPGGSRHASVV